MLQHHPDKRGSEAVARAAGDGETGAQQNDAAHVDIRLINEARWILGDEKRRREWEEVFFSSTSASTRCKLIKSLAPVSCTPS